MGSVEPNAYKASLRSSCYRAQSAAAIAKGFVLHMGPCGFWFWFSVRTRTAASCLRGLRRLVRRLGAYHINTDNYSHENFPVLVRFSRSGLGLHICRAHLLLQQAQAEPQRPYQARKWDAGKWTGRPGQ